MVSDPGRDALDGLIAAVNRHDLEGIAGRFTEDIRSDAPAHPSRSFVGREQVVRNWRQILGSIQDLEARLLASATTPRTPDGQETVWAEIAFDGRRLDGAPWRMRGVTVNEVVGDRIASVRFYMEPVEEAGPDSDGAARAMTTDSTAAPARGSR